jgi:hypothetical protein
MNMKHKYLFLTAGALFLASTAGAGFHAKHKEENADRKKSHASASHTGEEVTDAEKTLEETQPKTPVAAPPQQTPAAKTTAPATQPSVSLPSHVLNLASWKLQLPVKSEGGGTPKEVKEAALTSFVSNDHFYLNQQRDGVVFKANAGGATTKNSRYPRSELREMTSDGRSNAGWSNTNGTHTMTIRQAITHLPDVKNQLVAGQIHDSSDDVVMIRLEGSRLFVESGGKNIGDLDTNYTLGTVFTVKLVAEKSAIKVYYNDELKVTTAKSGDSYYFKAGCYTQTNTTKGDSAASYGEVTIYDLAVSHT